MENVQEVREQLVSVLAGLDVLVGSTINTKFSSKEVQTIVLNELSAKLRKEIMRLVMLMFQTEEEAADFADGLDLGISLEKKRQHWHDIGQSIYSSHERSLGIEI